MLPPRCHAFEAVFQKIALERCSSRGAVTSYPRVGSEGAQGFGWVVWVALNKLLCFQSRLCLVRLEGRCPAPSYHTFDLELPEDQRQQSMFHMRAAQKHCFKLQPLRDLGSKGSFLPGWAASANDYIVDFRVQVISCQLSTRHLFASFEAQCHWKDLLLFTHNSHLSFNVPTLI